MIMFVFFLISLININIALPTVEKPDIHIERTTVVPLHESVRTLQSAIRILFPKKDQNEKNFSVDRQTLLIGCLINRGRRACKGLHEKNDKNIFYEFDDKLLSDHLPIHVEHINVARVEKPINDTIEEIQKLITSENRLIKNETDGDLNSMSESSSSQNLVNLSRILAMKFNTMNLDGSRNKSKEEIFQWLSNNYTMDKTTDRFPNTATMKQVPQLQSMYSMNEQNENDQYDGNDFSIPDEQSTYIPVYYLNDGIAFLFISDLSSNNHENLSSSFMEENITDENHDNKLNISMFRISFHLQ